MRKNLKVRDGKPGIFGRFVWYSGAVICRRLFNRKLNLQYENWDILTEAEPPFLLVGNHVTNFDPIIISANQKKMFHWVANDAVFRHPLVGWAFRAVQSIPKTKGMSDLDTVRIMHKKVREGSVVAVFPEGQTNWDGLSQPMIPATAKLIKLMKVPVIGVVIKGGYLTQPRWVWPKNIRRSRIVLEAKELISGEEIKALKVDEIRERLDRGLFNDDFQFQKENPVRLESEKRAETLELFTYICPECSTLDALVSRGNTVRCQNCMWEFDIDEYGGFPEDNFPFTSLAEWGLWQQKETARLVKQYRTKSDPQEPLLFNQGLTMLTGSGVKPLRPLCKGDMKLWQDHLEFLPVDGNRMIFPLEMMEAVSIFKQQKLEFYYDRILYRFHYGSPRDSAYKWFKFLEEMDGFKSE